MSRGRRGWTRLRILRGIRKYALAALIDYVAVGLTYLLAVALRTGGRLDAPDPGSAVAVSVGAGILQVVGNLLFDVYWRDWSVAALEDLMSLVKASALVAFTLLVFNFFSDAHFYPTGAVLTAASLASGLEAAIKLRPRWRRILRAVLGQSRPGDTMIIVGAGRTGQLLARDLVDGPSDYRIACFVDDDPRKLGTSIRGVRVAGTVDDLPEVVARYHSSMVVIAAQAPGGPLIRRVVDLCENSDVRVRVARGFGLRTDDLSELRPIGIEELLEREAVDLNASETRRYLEDRVVLVTGAAGSIGSELCRQVARLRPRRLIALDQNESGLHDLLLTLPADAPSELVLGDIRDRSWLAHVFHEMRPQIVFHAAAYKHVPILQMNPAQGLSVNVLGTANVLAIANLNEVDRLVFISSDKAVVPTNVLGLTKRFGELLTLSYGRSLGRSFAAVRFGNVLGSNGSVVPIFNRQIEYGGPVTITHAEATRYFMTIPEAVGLVIEAGGIATPGDLLVLDMGAPVPIIELAKKMIRLRGLRPGKDIEIVVTGLRPGEKLHEELFFPEEVQAGTQRPHVIRVVSGAALPSLESLAEAVRHIELHLAEQSVDTALERLRTIVHGADEEVAPHVRSTNQSIAPGK